MRRYLLFLLAVCLVALAGRSATYYGFKIGGVSVNSDNYQNVTGDNIERGTVKYNPSTKTLTMSGVRIEREGSGNRAILNESCDGLTIIFEGENNFLAEGCSPVRFEANTTMRGADKDASVYTFGQHEYSALVWDPGHGNAGSIYITNGATLTIESLRVNAEAKNGSQYTDSDNPPIEGNGNETLVIRNSFVTTNYCRGGCIAHLKNLTVEKSVVCFKNSSSYESAYDIASLTLGDCVESNVTFSPEKKGFVDADGNLWARRNILINTVVPIDEQHFPDATLRNIVAEHVKRNFYYTRDYDSDKIYYAYNNGSGADRIIFEHHTEIPELFGKGISDLTGIEWFPFATSLNVSYNNLTALPSLSDFHWLTSVDVRCNNINVAGMRDAISSLPRRSADAAAATFNFRSCVPKDQDVENNCVPPLNWQPTAQSRNWKLTWWKTNGARGILEDAIDIHALNFPDDNFRNYLLAQDYGSDAKLTFQEIFNLSTLSLTQKNIANLEGIEWFYGLHRLDVQNNNLTGRLDLRSNALLTMVNCYNNKLTSLDLADLDELSYVQCFSNKLTAVNLRNNAALKTITIYRNQIKAPAMNDLVTHLPFATGTTSFLVYDNTGSTEGNIMTQGQILEARERGFNPQYYNGNQWLDYTGAPDYPITIAGIQVTSDNKNGITGPGIEGTVTYNPETNTLTLDNATIISDKKAIYVRYALPGIKIVLLGRNAIRCPSIIAVDIANCDGAVIEGPGELQFFDTAAAFYFSSGSGTGDHRLTIRNCGIFANDPTTYSPSGTVIMGDNGDESMTIENATVHLERGCIDSGCELQLVDCYIALPEGGHVDRGGVCEAGSNSYFSGLIEILPGNKVVRGDLNGDDAVDVDDMNILINMMLGKAEKTASADLNGDNSVDVDDMNAIINIMLGKA